MYRGQVMRFRMQHQTIVAICLTLAGTLAAGPALVRSQSTQPSPDEQAANSAMAESLAQMAQSSLAGKAIQPATLRQSAALLEAASRLDPKEPRFSHLLAEAYLQ